MQRAGDGASNRGPEASSAPEDQDTSLIRLVLDEEQHARALQREILEARLVDAQRLGIATGLIMARDGIDEDDALTSLHALSEQRGQPLPTVAEALIVEAAQRVDDQSDAPPHGTI